MTELALRAKSVELWGGHFVVGPNDKSFDGFGHRVFDVPDFLNIEHVSIGRSLWTPKLERVSSVFEKQVAAIVDSK